MGAKLKYQCEINSTTPKLSLSKLPCKPREPIQMLTPPLHPLVSIPFRWEEAPGKPRSASDVSVETASPPTRENPAVARCLELPPRLLREEGDITVMPSPASVLDGHYVGRSLSLACTFSFRKGLVAGWDDEFGPARKGGGGKFGPARRGRSFKDEEKLTGGNFDISHTLGEIFKNEKNAKITRVGRRGSFFNLLGIYASIKQTVPWRRNRR